MSAARRTALCVAASFITMTALMVAFLTVAPNASAKRIGVAGELYSDSNFTYSFWGSDATCNRACTSTNNNHTLASYNAYTGKYLDPTRNFASFEYVVDHDVVDEILIRAKGTRCGGVGPKMKVFVGLKGSSVATGWAHITKEAPAIYPNYNEDPAVWSETDRLYSAAMKNANGQKVSYKRGQTLMIKVTFSNPGKYNYGGSTGCQIWERDPVTGKSIGMRKLFVDWVAARGPAQRGSTTNPYWGA